MNSSKNKQLGNIVPFVYNFTFFFALQPKIVTLCC